MTRRAILARLIVAGEALRRSSSLEPVPDPTRREVSQFGARDRQRQDVVLEADPVRAGGAVLNSRASCGHGSRRSSPRSSRRPSPSTMDGGLPARGRFCACARALPPSSRTSACAVCPPPSRRRRRGSRRREGACSSPRACGTRPGRSSSPACVRLSSACLQSRASPLTPNSVSTVSPSSRAIFSASTTDGDCLLPLCARPSPFRRQLSRQAVAESVPFACGPVLHGSRAQVRGYPSLLAWEIDPPVSCPRGACRRRGGASRAQPA